MHEQRGIDPTAWPSGTGCAECLESEGWWLHLRRCAACGHIGCCDSSPRQHASAHAKYSGRELIQSFEQARPGTGTTPRSSSTRARCSVALLIDRWTSRHRDQMVESRAIGSDTCTDQA
jgi:hypothetical protein